MPPLEVIDLLEALLFHEGRRLLAADNAVQYMAIFGLLGRPLLLRTHREIPRNVLVLG